jgi:hypothetical protein
MAKGAKYSIYAKTLARLPDEPMHREIPDEKPLSIGKAVSGRLGIGDREMPNTLDRSSEGASNDVFRFVVIEDGRYVITMRSFLCTPHLTLVDARGVKIEGDMGILEKSTIKRRLTPGEYAVWAGAYAKGDLGLYELTVTRE